MAKFNWARIWAEIKRRWVYLLVGVVLLTLLVVLLIPSIASMGVVRGIVLGRINAGLHGKLEIKSWSLGWHSGIAAKGIELTGADGRVVSIDRLTTQLTLPAAIRGNYALGNVVIQGVHFDIKIDESGESNIAKVFQTAENKPANPASAAGGNSALPNVSGTITLKDVSGTIERADGQVIRLGLNGNLKVPDINQPIEDNLTVSAQTPDASPGTISLQGRVAAIAKNQILDVAQMSISQRVRMANIDLAALMPLLPENMISSLKGNARGELTASMAPGQPGMIDGHISATNVVAAGPALGADRYTTASLSIEIPETKISPNEIIRTAAPIQVKFDQGNFSAAIDAPIAAIQNLARNQAPGAAGSIAADAHLDIAALSHQLPDLFDLKKGMRLDTGRMVASTKITMAAEKTSAVQHIELSNISGRAVEGSNPVTLQPILLDASTAVLPSDSVIPQFRDIAIKLTSGFASADVHGPSGENLSGQGHADLAAAQNQLEQFIDFHGQRLAGLLDMTLSCKTNSTTPTSTDLVSQLKMHHLNFSGSESFHQEFAAVDISGTLLRDQTKSMTGIDKLKLTVLTSENASNQFDLIGTGSLRLHPEESGLRMLDALMLDVNIPDVPRVMALIAPLRHRNVVWNSGTARGNVHIAQSSGALVVESEFTGTNLAFMRESGAYQFQPIHFVVSVASNGSKVNISKLDGNFGAIANMQLIQPIVIALTPNPSAAGEIRATGDLTKLDELISAWNGQPAQHKLAGQFAMAQKFSTAGTRITANGAGTLNGLSIAIDPQTKFTEQSIKFGDNVAFDSGAQTLAIQSCSIAMQSSHALDANLAGTIRNLSTSRDFDGVHADISYDLAKLLVVIGPMLPDSTQQMLAGYKIAGIQKHSIQITGSLPKRQSVLQSIKHISVTGSIGLDSMEGNGITLTDLTPSFHMVNGVLKITGNGPTPANLNDGALNITGIFCDLSNPNYPISAPANLPLISGTHLNEAMLGKFGSNLNPLLSNPKEAAGVLDVTLVQCNRLYLTQFTNQMPPDVSTGSANVVISIHDLHLANDMSVLIGVFAPRSLLKGQLVGNINNAKFSINNNVVGSNMTLVIGKNLTMGFHGNIDLRTQKLHNFVLDFPTPMIADVINNPQITQFLPTSIPIAISGTTKKYSLDLANSVGKLIPEAIAKGGIHAVQGVGNLIGGLGNVIKQGVDKKKDSRDASSQPSQGEKKKSDNPLKNLFGK